MLQSLQSCCLLCTETPGLPGVGNVMSRAPAERAERHPMLTEEAQRVGSQPLFPGKATHVLPFPIWPAATVNFSREVV